jgi:hypothetical protein
MTAWGRTIRKIEQGGINGDEWTTWQQHHAMLLRRSKS